METMTSKKLIVALSLMPFCISLFSCSAATPEKSTDSKKNPSQRIAELQVVDCLLPGQTRTLGNQVYLTPRVPASITASECSLRGGEYVAYDRADYKTSLAVWMPSAEAGDANAQANIGEIFEKGLGGEPNYEIAAMWYKKSADQGNQRALFNLGTLYEQGLGVEKDKLIAMNYYRKAWGLPEDSLVYQSAVSEQQKELEEKLQLEISKKDQQLQLLESQIASLNSDLQKQKQNANQIATLNEMIADLKTQNSASKVKLAAITNTSGNKLRTVITKNDATFNATGTDIISKDINFGKFYALVIGVQNYDHVEKLDTPVNDINAVADILSNDYGFTVTKVVNADNISIMEAINNLNSQLTENDNLLIFYAGHGVRVSNDIIQEGYWLPVNADAPPRDTNWVANEFITRHLALLKAKRVLVVADSCYAGLLSTSPDMLMLGKQQNSLEFIKYKANKRSRLLLTSGGDKPVLDSNGKQNSIFAAAFIDALKNNNEIMTGPQLFEKVHDRVVKESSAAKFRQDPEYKAIKGAGHEVGEFFFVPNKKG